MNLHRIASRISRAAALNPPEPSDIDATFEELIASGSLQSAIQEMVDSENEFYRANMAKKNHGSYCKKCRGTGFVNLGDCRECGGTGIDPSNEGMLLLADIVRNTVYFNGIVPGGDGSQWQKVAVGFLPDDVFNIWWDQEVMPHFRPSP